MNRRELMRLAFTPGPMQKLAQASLLEEYDADDRVQAHDIARSSQLDPYAYLDAYTDTVLPRQTAMVPSGDESLDETRREDAQREAVKSLMELYDKPWYQDAWDIAKGAATPENAVSLVHEAGNTFLPIYSQMDSLNWAEENLDKFVNAQKYGIDPLSALLYLPNAALGALGTVPGISQVMSGGRKLGKGTEAMLEGMF